MVEMRRAVVVVFFPTVRVRYHTIDMSLRTDAAVRSAVFFWYVPARLDGRRGVLNLSADSGSRLTGGRSPGGVAHVPALAASCSEPVR